MKAAGGDAAIFGKPAHLLRLLPGKSDFLDVFGNWVLVLRSNALLYAQMTAALRPSDYTRFRQVYDAANHVVTNHATNPVAWFGGRGF